ncbi:Hsp20/alpha crystallin family protein [Rhizobacter sp. Root1221]|uniref:Hsp20/alpha crystallin family protein n=1 Tax=Rhizobacter sp. Root1221 TaxID=1736433 RepID=UPI000700B42B|nr:Hsp20/alpha crystallin family protein [Rhizobacter sp. Root1221]KQW02682.1 heat-shock protein Hsp20 [Rhizobacter sp. Root1221]
MYDSLFDFPGTLFGELERLQRLFDDPTGSGRAASIRSVAPGAFPAVNVGNTPTSVEVYAFAPGIDPAKLNLTLDRGVLTLAGERDVAAPDRSGNGYAYSRERPTGRFRRTVSLPDDIDPSRVDAHYQDGVLRVSISRRAEAQPQRIAIQ